MKKNNELNSNQTMLQQFLLNKDKSNLTVGDIVSMMSEFLLGAFDTVNSVY